MELIGKVKARLIHRLGGKTKMETMTTSLAGGYLACARLKDTADSLYGKSPDEWCDEMYRAITNLGDQHMALMAKIEEMSLRQGKRK